MKSIFNKILFATFFIVLGCQDDAILNQSENLSDVPVMDLIMSHDDLVEFRSNRTNDKKFAVNIFFSGEKKTGKIEASGAGSRYHPRWSYEIELDEDQFIEGLSQFNLSAQIFDPTMLHTTLALHYYEQIGLPTFISNHIFLKINNEDEALLITTEEIDEEYFNRRNKPVFELFKVEFGAKFTFEGGHYPQFHYDKEIPDNGDFGSIEELINAVDKSSSETLPQSLGKFLDIENYIKYHAATSILNNDDSFTNNFFLIKEELDSPFRIIPWDFDKCFSRFNDVEFAGENAIIKKIFEKEITFNMYKNELKHQIENIYMEENLFSVIDFTAEKIREAYNIDPYLGKGRYNFDQEIEFLKNYIKERRKFFEDNLENLTQDYFNK